MVSILLFGELKEKMGKSELEIQLNRDLKIEELFCQVLGDDPQLKRWQDKVLFAINQEQVNRGSMVHDGDEVAFMPPVAGG